MDRIIAEDDRVVLHVPCARARRRRHSSVGRAIALRQGIMPVGFQLGGAANGEPVAIRAGSDRPSTFTSVYVPTKPSGSDAKTSLHDAANTSRKRRGISREDAEDVNHDGVGRTIYKAQWPPIGHLHAGYVESGPAMAGRSLRFATAVITSWMNRARRAAWS